MTVNGITGVDAYSTYQAQTYEKKDQAVAKTEEVAAIYEPSNPDTKTVEESKSKIPPNPELVAKLKAETEARTSQLKSLVEKIILQQADKSQNIFDFLGSEYSAEDIAKAKEDVSEDGYYGVKQTSQRILDFAVALVGDDPDKLEKMRSAFEKGYEMAEKTWGGELPEICKQTYDAVLKGFDDMANQEAE